MLALMLYAEARRAARRDAAGAYVPLEQQDIALWDDRLVETAESLLYAANAGGPTGRFQIEAAIQSAHVARRTLGAPTWPAVLALYDHLLALTGSPVIALNRAVALAEIEGPAAALAAISSLEADKRMVDYQPYWAARGHLLAQAGRRQEAREALTVAIGLARDDAVRRYLQARRQTLGAEA
jgi:RNA polymerase sigma-70 factor (ECF subfamily)